MDKNTVIGPESALPAVSSEINPLTFGTNQTNKTQCSGALLIWAEIKRMFSKVDSRTNPIIETIGLVIYMAYEYQAKVTLRTEETDKRIVLKGTEDDPECINLINQIIYIIGHESPAKRM